MKSKALKGGWVIIFDMLIIALSLVSAWGIRSSFKNLLFDLDRLLFILPYFIFTRITANLILEDYRLSFYNFQSPDLSRILWHNGFPTILFLTLRYFTHFAPVRIPTSIILAEYVLTFAGMVLVRLLILRRVQGRAVRLAAHRKKRVIFYGNTRELDSESAATLFGANTGLEVVNIFSPDRLQWNLDYQGVRIGGGIRELKKYIASDNTINSLVLYSLKDREEALTLWGICKDYSVSLFLLENGDLQPAYSEATLFSALFPPVFIPDELYSRFSGTSFAVVGAESILSQHIERICLRINKENLVSYPLLYNPLEVDSADIIFDLRCTLAEDEEYNITVYCAILREQVSTANQYLSKTAHKIHLVAVLPGVEAACAADCFKTSENITLLFTESLISEKSIRLNKPLPGWVESPASVAAGIFKVLALNNKFGGIYYLRSTQAVQLSEGQTEEPFEFLGQVEKSGFTAEETECFQVYKLIKKDKT
ncbi:MAG: hypothetical protein GH155_00750 [Spirochaeta sp.]|nr:hypothetical protein [Spirochaeta sp.]